MSKKYLRKNEVRVDLNPNHFNKYGSPHEAYIFGKKGHSYKANTQTHSKYVDGILCYDLEPEKPIIVRHSRVSPPFWQNEKQFGAKIPNKKIPKKYKSKIQRYNRKFR